MFDRLQQDTRGAWRSLRRSPVTTLVAILSLAAGIGATTVTLTVRDIVFHRPPPSYSHPEGLSRVQVGTLAHPIRRAGSAVAPQLFTEWRESLGPSIAGAISLGRRTVRAGDRREDIGIRAATPELFDVLGVEVSPGTSFSRIASGSARETAAILSYRVWQQMFDGRPDALGASIWIGDRAYTVAGLLPARFWFSDMDASIWTALDPARLPPDQALTVVVRRAAGETSSMLEARLKTGLDAYARRLPEDQRQLLVQVSGIEGTPVGEQVSIVLPYVLGTAVLLTLLIACANVAILLMARWTAREHEIAIRASIGASRGRIIRSLLTESVTIAAGGALLGIGVTFALNAFIASRTAGGAFFDLSVNWRILLQATAVAVAAGVLSGIVPALHETRRLQWNPLRALAGAERARQRWRHALVVLEITVTIALLVVTVTMIDGYLRVAQADLGYAPAPLITVRVENPGGVPADRVAEALAAIPGVVAASASTGVPFSGNGARVAVSAARDRVPVMVERIAIDDRFFDALGVPIVAGRAFSRRESRETRTAIVNQVLADRLFAGRAPLGSHLSIADASYEIVGVVANYASHPLRAAQPEPRLFVPLAPHSPDVIRMMFLVRTDGNPAAVARSVGAEVERIGNGTIVTNTETLTQMITIMGQEMIVGTAPLLPLVAIGVMLTSAGIYGVLAFAIARRSRELAVRVAIGASASDIVRLVVAHTVRLVVTGSIAGLAAMVGLARVVRAGGGAGSIWDPSVVAFVIPLVLVCGVAAMATWVPSRRALSIDPAVLLRQQ
jgi:putative ABC transport system permease protein